VTQAKPSATSASAETTPSPTGSRKSEYVTRNLTEGSIPRTLWFLAWPQMVTGALRAADQLADLFWAGFIGFHAVAGIGISQTWAALFNTGRTGLDVAARAMISRAYGARDIPLANHLAIQSILLNAIVSFSWISVAVIFAPVFFQVLNASDELIEQGLWYMRFRFIGSFFFTMTLCTSSAISAAGDSVTSMKAQSFNRIANVVLGPFFVFGWLGLPAMGIAGTGFAFLLAQLPGTAMNFYALFKGSSRLHLKLRDVRIDLRAMWRQIRIGAPAAVTSAERSFAQIVVYGLVAPFGDLSLAAYSLTSRMQTIVNLGYQGLGSASGVLVGQNLGAKEPQRAVGTVWWALAFTAAISLGIGIVMVIFPQIFVLIFTRDPALVEVASVWLQIMVIGFMAMGIGTVFAESFNTAGDTFIPMVVTLATIWAVQQPVAIFLSGLAHDWSILGREISTPINLGQYGVAWAMVIAMAVRLLVYFPYFVQGRWLKSKVL
jgi:putative MATE family efflux protein